jgi:hypothetical protein
VLAILGLYPLKLLQYRLPGGIGCLEKLDNGHLQTVLIEAAKLAPRWNPQLATVHDRELERGTRNRATLVVARKLVTGGRQIRPTLPHPESACPHNGGGNSGLTIHSELTSGKGGFPAATARRLVRGSGTVLAVKGSLRRAQIRRVLDCGPFHPIHSCDGRLRRENQTPPCRSTAAICLRSTGRSLPDPTATGRNFLLMGHTICFQAGRFTSIQSSWTASRCSRKWMSGPATACCHGFSFFMPDRK